MANDLLAGLETKYQLPNGLLNAVMQQESGGDGNAVSPKGARGYFQFMPKTAVAYNVDPHDLNSSADGAARMYKDLLKTSGGDLDKALASYNYGQGNVSKSGMNNLPKETKDYITKVKSRMPTNDYVTDPKLLAQLGDPSTPAKTSEYVTDPELLKQLGAPNNNETGTLYTQSQLNQAKTPPTFTQDLQKELADNPYSAKFAAAGTALSDIAQGTKQLFGGDINKPISLPMGRAIPGNKDNKTISDANKGSAFAGNASLYALGGIAPALNTVKGATIGGAVIGALAPTEQDSVVKGKLGGALVGAGAGAAGAKIGQALVNSLANKTAAGAVAKSQNANADANVKSAIDAGYKLTPTYAGGGTISTALEGISGKFKTQELAGIKNQNVTNALARKGLGLPENASISEAAINDLKVPHNAIYKEASSLPSGIVGQSTTKSLATGKDVTTNIVKSGDQLVSQWKEASDSARAAYKAANSPLSPNPNEMRAQAKEFAAKADSLQNQIQTLAENNGKSDLVDRLKDARKNLARIYTYEDALNPETSHIDAKQIGKALQNDKPLDEHAITIGKFANGFGDLAKVPKVREASPITPLDVVSSALTGGIAPIARLGSRAAVLSPLMQKSLANKSYQPSNLSKALSTLRYAPMAVAGTTVKALSK